MAAKGIRRIVQLILDKATAAQVRRETADALEKGTDPRKAKRNLSVVESGMAKLKAAAMTLGAALAAAFAVRKIFQFGKEAVRTAMEAEAIWSRLGHAVENAGQSFEELEPHIRATARALQDVTTVGDEDMAGVLTELITITNDVEASLDAVSVVADLAAAKQIELITAAQLVGRAMVGQTSTLTRYGIVIEEGADAVEVMRQRFAGFAENEAQTFEGRLKQLNNEWADFKEAVGAAMIAAGGGTSVLETLTGVVRGLAEWVARNHGAFEGFARILGWVATAAGLAWDGLSRLAHGIAGVLMGTVANGALVVSVLADGLALAAEAAEKFYAVIGARRASGEMAAFAARIRRSAQDIKEFVDVAKQAERELYDSFLFGNRTAPAPRPPAGLGSPLRPPGGAPGGAPGGGGGTGDPGPLTPFEEFQQTLKNIREEEAAQKEARRQADLKSKIQFGAGGLAGGFQPLPTPTLDPVPVQTSLEKIAATAYETEYEITAGVQRVTDAFIYAFETIADGSASLGQAFAGIGLEIVAGLTEGMAQYHFAQAAGKLAEGLWPPNPAALGSAAQHAVAGGLFAALTGLARSKARGGGRGGGGMARGGSAAALARAPRAERPGNEIHVHFIGPGFDAVNPQVQSVVAGTIKNLGERHGSNYNVQIHRKR
jgi:hypothetical protein